MLIRVHVDHVRVQQYTVEDMNMKLDSATIVCISLHQTSCSLVKTMSLEVGQQNFQSSGPCYPNLA